MIRLPLALLLLLLVCGCVSQPAAPNIVLIVADDLGWQDTSVLVTAQPTIQNLRYKTPHLERLAREGVRFTNAASAAPVCTPSRAAILTGVSPARSHITHWTLYPDRDTGAPGDRLQSPPWRREGVQPPSPTLATLLAGRGYRTIHVGKAHWGAFGTPGADPLQLGFAINHAGHAAGAPASHRAQDRFASSAPTADPVWNVPGLEEFAGSDLFLEEALAELCVREIRAAARGKTPFFLHYAPYSVHTPIQANPRHLADYPGLDEREAAYATMVASVDAAVGRILGALEQEGMLESTLIVFTSDNGGLSAVARGVAPDGSREQRHNAPLRSGKGSAYEGGTRVPLLVRWPKVTIPGTRVHAPVIGTDLFPTLLHAAGVEASSDGRDLRPLLEGKAAAARELLWHQPHVWGPAGPGLRPFSSLRIGDEKLIYFHGERFELYDLAHDPGEQQDLALQAPDRLRALVLRLDALLAESQAQFPLEKGSAQPLPGPRSWWERECAKLAR